MKRWTLYSLALVLSAVFTADAVGATKSHSDWKKEYRSYQYPDYRIPTLPDRFEERKEQINEELIRLIEFQKQWELNYAKDTVDFRFFQVDGEWKKELESLSEQGVGERLSKKIDLPTFLTLAVLRNPGVKATQNRYRAAMEKFSQTFDLEETLNQYRSFTRDLKIPFGPKNHMDPIGKDYPVPGVTTLKAEVINQDIKIQSLRYSSVLRDLRTNVIKAYEQYVFLNHAIRITRENLELFRKLEESAQVKYDTGRSGYNAVIQIQIRIDRLANELKDLQQDRQAVETRLMELADLLSGFRLGTPVPNQPVSLKETKQELIQTGLAERQEIQIARASARKMELMIQMSEKMVVPQSAAGYSNFGNQLVNQVGTDAKKPAFPLKQGVKPKFFFGTRSAFIREMKGKLLAMNNEVERRENMTVNQVTTAYYKWDKGQRDRNLFKKSLLGLADQSVEVSQAEYVSDLIDFPELLDSHNRQLNFRIGYFGAVRDQNQALADLERIVGQPLSQKEEVE